MQLVTARNLFLHCGDADAPCRDRDLHDIIRNGVRQSEGSKKPDNAFGAYRPDLGTAPVLHCLN